MTDFELTVPDLYTVVQLCISKTKQEVNRSTFSIINYQNENNCASGRNFTGIHIMTREEVSATNLCKLIYGNWIVDGVALETCSTNDLKSSFKVNIL